MSSNLDKTLEAAREYLAMAESEDWHNGTARIFANALIDLTTPVEISEGHHRTSWTCPACQLQMFSTYRHCPHCGKRITWKT